MSETFKRSVLRAKQQMRTGAKLMRMHSITDEMKWYLVPGGEVPNKIAQALINEPDVKPGNDGLFPGISQSWGII